MRGVLMGNPPQKQLAPLQIGRQAPVCWKPLLISAFTRWALYGAVRVYARKRIGMMTDARISKLLIQSAFTSPDGNSKPVYRQRPIWG
jgi:hypothetical protein